MVSQAIEQYQLSTKTSLYIYHDQILRCNHRCLPVGTPKSKNLKVIRFTSWSGLRDSTLPMKFASKLIHGGQVQLCYTQVSTAFHVVYGDFMQLLSTCWLPKSNLVISMHCVMLTSELQLQTVLACFQNSVAGHDSDSLYMYMLINHVLWPSDLDLWPMT